MRELSLTSALPLHPKTVLYMNKTILIIEDEVIIGMALAAELEDYGYHVTDIVCSAEEALNTLQTTPIDLLILDIKISGSIDGLDLLTEIRKISQPSVIIISGNSDSNTHKRIKNMKVDGFFVKPVNTEELVRKIKSLP